jgi:hypothetical protein
MLLPERWSVGVLAHGTGRECSGSVNVRQLSRAYAVCYLCQQRPSRDVPQTHHCGHCQLSSLVTWPSPTKRLCKRILLIVIGPQINPIMYSLRYVLYVVCAHRRRATANNSGLWNQRNVLFHLSSLLNSAAQNSSSANSNISPSHSRAPCAASIRSSFSSTTLCRNIGST